MTTNKPKPFMRELGDDVLKKHICKIINDANKQNNPHQLELPLKDFYIDSIMYSKFPLHRLLSFGHLSILQTVLEEKYTYVDINEKYDNGNTLLHEICNSIPCTGDIYDHMDEHYSLIKTIFSNDLDAVAKLKINFKIKNDKDETAFICACKAMNLEVVKLFLEKDLKNFFQLPTEYFKKKNKKMLKECLNIVKPLLKDGVKDQDIKDKLATEKQNIKVEKKEAKQQKKNKDPIDKTFGKI